MKAYLLMAVRQLYFLALVAAFFYFGVLPVIQWCMTGQHPILEALRQHVTQHLPDYLAVVSLLGVAFICTMPQICPFIRGEIDTPFKRMVQALWTWLRDGLQTATPAARARQEAHSQSSTQTPTTTTTQEATSSKAIDPQIPLAPKQGE